MSVPVASTACLPLIVGCNTSCVPRVSLKGTNGSWCLSEHTYRKRFEHNSCVDQRVLVRFSVLRRASVALPNQRVHFVGVPLVVSIL